MTLVRAENETLLVTGERKTNSLNKMADLESEMAGNKVGLRKHKV